jgi:hypothetical protein
MRLVAPLELAFVRWSPNTRASRLSAWHMPEVARAARTGVDGSLSVAHNRPAA